MKRFLRALTRYLIFFLLVAFLVTCCIMLFVTTLTGSLGIELTGDDLNIAAKLTFANVILLSLMYMSIDALRRKWTVQRSVRRITEAARRIIAGDFAVRIPQTSGFTMEDGFSDIIDCFNQMAKELSSVETLRLDFITNVSHELKTPLAAIQNYGTLLQSSGLSEEKRLEYAQGVTDNAHRLGDMMTSILRLSKLENQQIFPKAEIFDLSAQLCETLLQYESIWEQEGIEIDTEIPDNVAICADRDLLELVWNNLLSNAFKFTPQGGTVRLALTSTPQEVVVQVQDTGCGMSAETGEHIFEKFYQGDASRATKGNGLGLALVKRVMDIVRGEIRVESTLGKGSTFTVTIRRS